MAACGGGAGGATLPPPAWSAPADACPDADEDLDGHEDGDGCPDPDNDLDGILDVDDLCPCVPEDADGFDDGDGCPDPDNDGDHIADACDACPDDPETWNGSEDEDGCPDRTRVLLVSNELMILEKIFFGRGRDRITDEANPVLDAIAQVLREHPRIRTMTVHGHADAREPRPARLALRRARAVYEALIERGVERERLDYASHGADRPLREGRGEENAQHNRRVEFTLDRVDPLPPPSPSVVPRAVPADCEPQPMTSVCTP